MFTCKVTILPVFSVSFNLCSNLVYVGKMIEKYKDQIVLSKLIAEVNN
jgi:hypothetical protein